MNILLLCGLFPPEIQKRILEDSIGVVQNAANVLQFAIARGLYSYSKQLKIVSLPYIGNYPKYYRRPYFRGRAFSYKYGSNDICLSFNTIPFLTLIERYFKAWKKIDEWSSKQDEESWLIIYAMYYPFIKAAIDNKKKHCKLKVCLVIPDLPLYMSENRNILYRLFKKIEMNFINKMICKIDAFVVFSDYMIDALNIIQKPCVRIEGIYCETDSSEVIRNDDENIILYAGTVDYRYGIGFLLESFMNIKSNAYRLLICGEGNARKLIEEYTLRDKRITYLGQLSREKTILLQKKATILINPRKPEHDYTKYSFPSKILEYLASGTPTIMYRLMGIPEEYFKYVFIPKDETIESLSELIVDISKMDKKFLEEHGKKSREFVLEEKNATKQCEKIYSLLNNFNNGK